MRVILDPEDYEEIRGEMEGILDFVPSNEQIDRALARDPSLLGLAAAWYWNDTEVRDQLAELLEREL